MEALARWREPNSAALRAVYQRESDMSPPIKQTACYLQAENIHLGVSLIVQLVKNLPAMQETLVQFLGQEDPLEKG